MGWQPGRGEGAGAEPGPDPGPAGSRETPDDAARHSQLAGFARDGEWDACPPSAFLAVALEAASGNEWRCPGAARDEMFGLLRRWAALESWAVAGKLGVLRALIREEGQPPAGGGYHGDLPDGWTKSLTHEVALALAMPPQSAEKLLQTAWDLQAVLPGIGALLADGTLTYAKARAVDDALAVLTDEDAAKAEAMIVPELAGKTYGQAENLAVQAAITVDPQSATKRREDAERNRARIALRRDPSGAASLAGYDLPTDETLAAHANVCARATQYKDSGAFPGVRMDQFRAMAYVDILNGITAETRIACGQPRAGLGAPNDYGPDDDAVDPDNVGPSGEDPEDPGPKGGSGNKAGPDNMANPPTHAPDGDTAGPDMEPPDTTGRGAPGSAPGSGHSETPDATQVLEDPEDPEDEKSPDDRDPNGKKPKDPGPKGSHNGGTPDAADNHEDPEDGPEDQSPDDGNTSGEKPENHRPEDRPDDQDPDDGSPSGEDPEGPGPKCGPDSNVPSDGSVHGTVGPGSAGTNGSDGGAGGDTGGASMHSGGPRPPAGSPPEATPPSQPAHFADLVLPLTTLLGLAERPGEGHGLGPLDPDLGRALAETAANSRYSSLCVTVTGTDGIAIGHGCARLGRSRLGSDRHGPGHASPMRAAPVHGPPRVLAALPARVNLTITADCLARLTEAAVLGAWSFTRTADPGPPGGFGTWDLALPDGRHLTARLEPVPTLQCDHRHESHAYQPNDTLRHLVQIRDHTCTFPTCSRHARESDFEHATPFDKGGRTCACNAGARSRACHRVKQAKGWKVTQPRPGWHQWETPSGRIYTQNPKRYPV